MPIMIAHVLVYLRGLRNRVRGHGDRAGLTVPCRGCDDRSPHDGHLARGAAEVLGTVRKDSAR